MASRHENNLAADRASLGNAAKQEVFLFTKMVVSFLVVFLMLKSFVIEGYPVEGPSMEPTLYTGQRILVFKLPHVLSRLSWFSNIEALHPGDVVVFRSADDPEELLVKRVIAKGHQRIAGNIVAAATKPANEESVSVQIKRGELYVDNHRVEETYLPGGTTQPFRPSEVDQVVLNPGEYYVVGDNRPYSADSRIFGPIDDSKVIGKAVFRIWPLGKMGYVR